jgi:two-component system LytT family sensor kinase
MLKQVIAASVASLLAAAAVNAVMRTRRRKRQARSRAVRLEREAAHARLRAAAAYLEPHFMFNTLNAIAALVRVDTDEAERMLVQFSRLLRLALDDRSRTVVSLRTELNALEIYLSIQQMRCGDRLTVSRMIDDAALNAVVPSLILQPLVENAIMHGLAPRGGVGAVEIIAERVNDVVHIAVVDDGVGLPPHPTWGDGLATTRARLAAMFPGANDLELAPGYPSGTRVSVTFAYKPASEEPLPSEDLESASLLAV